MKNEKNETIKVVLIILLSIIFVLVAYFRFFHNQPIRATTSTAPSLGEPGTVSPAAPDAAREQKKESPGDGFQIARTVTRNIFTPAKAGLTEGETKTAPGENAEDKPLPSLKLSGVIVDERSSIAIINGKFLRNGDRIEGYQIVRIGAQSVQLSGNGGTIVLNVLTTMDKQF